MSKFVAMAKSFVLMLKQYPAISAALVNVGVIALGYVGLHLTESQFVYYVGVVVVLFGVIVHSNVKPLVKVEEAAKVLEVTPVGEHVVHEVEAEVAKQLVK